MEKVVPFRTGYGSGLCAAWYDGSFLFVLFTLSSARGAVAIGNSLYMFARANTQSVLCTVAIGNVLYMFAYANTQSAQSAVAQGNLLYMFAHANTQSDADGHVSGTVDYDIFGEPVTETGVFAANSTIVFAYAGKPYDPVTGLSDYGFRDYAPSLARFTTVDPICAKRSCDRKLIVHVRSREHAIRDGSNWYAYCNSDPVNYVDAWGLVCISNDDAEAAAKTVMTNAKGRTDKLSDIEDTSAMAKKIADNIDLLDDQTRKRYDYIPDQYRAAAVKSDLDKITVTTGVSRADVETAAKSLGINDSMANGIASGNAFSIAGHIMYLGSQQPESYTNTHESIHFLQSLAYGGAGDFLTAYFTEAEKIDGNGGDWYYDNEFEIAAYSFGPENIFAKTNKYDAQGYAYVK